MLLCSTGLIDEQELKERISVCRLLAISRQESFRECRRRPESERLVFGKNGEAGDIGHIINAARHRPGSQQAAQSRTEFSGRLQEES